MLQTAAIMLTAVALAPGLAHAFELPAKIGMNQGDYFIVQGIYRGWAMLGGLLILAVLVDGIYAYSLRDVPGAFGLAMSGTVVLAATLAVFFAFTFPANAATHNWTVQPSNWEALRTRWEYSHLVNAGLTFVSLALIVLASVRRA